jgi:hypothetical protein
MVHTYNTIYLEAETGGLLFEASPGKVSTRLSEKQTKSKRTGS